METELERIAEHVIDVPMPQILEEIVEIEAIVDISVLQFEFIFHVHSFFFAVAWSAARLSLFIFWLQFFKLTRSGER